MRFGVRPPKRCSRGPLAEQTTPVISDGGNVSEITLDLTHPVIEMKNTDTHPSIDMKITGTPLYRYEKHWSQYCAG